MDHSMDAQIDPVSALKRSIVRGKARLERWDQELAAIEPWWLGGTTYKLFCEELAAAARQKNADLEAELDRHYTN
jgi:hypothetical protein